MSAPGQGTKGSQPTNPKGYNELQLWPLCISRGWENPRTSKLGPKRNIHNKLREPTKTPAGAGCISAQLPKLLGRSGSQDQPEAQFGGKGEEEVAVPQL